MLLEMRPPLFGRPGFLDGPTEAGPGESNGMEHGRESHNQLAQPFRRGRDVERTRNLLADGVRTIRGVVLCRLRARVGAMLSCDLERTTNMRLSNENVK